MENIFNGSINGVHTTKGTIFLKMLKTNKVSFKIGQIETSETEMQRKNEKSRMPIL
jgi:hypothetical protein